MTAARRIKPMPRPGRAPTLRPMPVSRDTALPFVDLLAAESGRFRSVLADTPATAPVPTCPDWVADDLLWHLGECQWFWARVLVDDLRTDQQIEDLVEAERPADRDDLLSFFDTHSAELVTAGRAGDETLPRWMWVSDTTLHHAGYLLRRQAHEALIHRVDAELCARRTITEPDPRFAADGVDEALRLIHGNTPTWGTFAADGRQVAVVATDTGDRWVLHLGRFTGSRRDDNETVDVPLWSAATGESNDGPVDATVSGTAWDLDLWLWGRRSDSALTLEGDDVALTHAREVVADGVG